MCTVWRQWCVITKEHKCLLLKYRFSGFIWRHFLSVHLNLLFVLNVVFPRVIMCSREDVVKKKKSVKPKAHFIRKRDLKCSHSLVSHRWALGLLQKLVLIFFVEKSWEFVPAFSPGPLHLQTAPKHRVKGQARAVFGCFHPFRGSVIRYRTKSGPWFCSVLKTSCNVLNI